MGQRGTPLQEADLQKVVVVVVVIAVAVLVVRRPQAYWPAQEHRNDAEVQNLSHRNLMSTKKTERETQSCLPPFLEFTFNLFLLPFIYLTTDFILYAGRHFGFFRGSKRRLDRLLLRHRQAQSAAAAPEESWSQWRWPLQRAGRLLRLFSFGCPRADKTSMVGSEIQC